MRTVYFLTGAWLAAGVAEVVGDALGAEPCLLAQAALSLALD